MSGFEVFNLTSETCFDNCGFIRFNTNKFSAGFFIHVRYKYFEGNWLVCLPSRSLRPDHLKMFMFPTCSMDSMSLTFRERKIWINRSFHSSVFEKLSSAVPSVYSFLHLYPMSCHEYSPCCFSFAKKMTLTFGLSLDLFEAHAAKRFFSYLRFLLGLLSHSRLILAASPIPRLWHSAPCLVLAEGWYSQCFFKYQLKQFVWYCGIQN